MATPGSIGDRPVTLAMMKSPSRRNSTAAPAGATARAAGLTVSMGYASHQARRFPCRVDASDVNDHGHKSRGAQDDNHHQTGDRQCGLDRAEAGIGG